MAGFSQGVRKVLWERAGHRCSKCARGTSKPNPDDTNDSLILGEGAHIHGDKPGAPRHLPDQTPEERDSATNGIWLCERCHNEMDKAWAAYPADVIRGWKSDREATAARDAAATPDEIGAAIAELKALELLGAQILEKLVPPRTWDFPRANASEEERHRAFVESVDKGAVQSKAMRDELHRELEPRINALLPRVTTILGGRRPSVVAAQWHSLGWTTNPLSVRAFLATFSVLRNDLSMR